jgi:DNA-binding HxlR family transcriptional regulator
MTRHAHLNSASCPVARSLDRVGEWWSILILRDAMYGLTRFDEFEKSLGIAPNMLTRRLNDLVEAGMLEKVRYCDKPPRYEYVLTELGWSFRSVMQAFVDWGNRHFFPEGRAVQLTERATGRPVRVGMVDLDTGKPINPDEHVMAPGPAADKAIEQRFAYVNAKRAGLTGKGGKS